MQNVHVFNKNNNNNLLFISVPSVDVNATTAALTTPANCE